MNRARPAQGRPRVRPAHRKGHELIADEAVDALEYLFDGGAGGDRVKHGLGEALQTAAGKDVADETRTVTEAVAALPRGAGAGPIATLRCPLARMG